MRKYRIAFDMDDTLTITKKFKFGKDHDNHVAEIYKTAKANPVILGILISAMEQDFQVYIYTSRDERFRTVTEDWLCEQLGFDYLDFILVLNKQYFDFYIGDEAHNVAEFF